MGKSVESKVQAPSTPIWQSENSELYSSSPGIERYVIWECNPNDENVKKYPKFDALDPLPHHYYESDEEHEKARESYRVGIYPDRRFDVNIYFQHLEKEAVPKSSSVVVFPELKDQESLIKEKPKAA